MRSKCGNLPGCTDYLTVSILNLNSFGGGTVAALRAAFSASQTGDTIDLAGLTITNVPQLTIPGGRTIKGSGASISAAGTGYVFQLDPANANDVTITGVKFTGRAIRIFANNLLPKRITISGCTFAGDLYADRAPEPNSILALGCVDTRISNNEFTGGGDGGIVSRGGTNLQIIGNNFHDTDEGAHIFGNYGPPGSVEFVENYGERLTHKLAEIQGPWLTVVVTDNYCGDFDAARVIKQGSALEPMGLSIAADGSLSVEVHRNKIVSHSVVPSTLGMTGMRIGIELGASPTTDRAINCSDNYIDLPGPQSVAIALNTSLGGSVHDNRVIGGMVSPAPLAKSPRIANTNTSATALSWDANRAWPLGSAPVTGEVTHGVPLPDSPDNTVVMGSGSLSFGGNTYTISLGTLLVNAVADSHTSGITSILLMGGVLYQLVGGSNGSIGQWWKPKLSGAPPINAVWVKCDNIWGIPPGAAPAPIVVNINLQSLDGGKTWLVIA